MSGGRLTRQERHQIALGLADGLAYAEIARGLDRPTSTVTREVLRNGGPAGYRADLAQHATEHRAHRSRQSTARRARPAPAEGGRDAEKVREYEESFATVFTDAGLPKMTARLLVALYTTDSGGLTAAELVRRLQVSPASVSKAIAFLEHQGLVRRERDEGRRERYLVDDDVFYESIMTTVRANLRLAETARRGVEVLGPDTQAAVRLEGIARFVDVVADSIRRSAEEARDILHAYREEHSQPFS
ncbi:MarR family transcriptional regulator [Amycolatopsis sp. NPDC059090]|uniref:GbsR/MarR family transcriptional regulator n=1 Tax=unclassified Amycolatopsis TaxID=2618356 RepID=UPI00366C3F80